MAAPVSLSRWFGSFSRGDEARAQCGLAFPKVCEKRPHVKAAIGRQLLAYSVDFRDNRVFPHDAMLP